MARARKCERCDKYYDEYGLEDNDKDANSIMFTNVDYDGRYYTHKRLDLCKQCMLELYSWFNKYNEKIKRQ